MLEPYEEVSIVFDASHLKDGHSGAPVGGSATAVLSVSTGKLMIKGGTSTTGTLGGVTDADPPDTPPHLPSELQVNFQRSQGISSGDAELAGLVDGFGWTCTVQAGPSGAVAKIGVSVALDFPSEDTPPRPVASVYFYAGAGYLPIGGGQSSTSGSASIGLIALDSTGAPNPTLLTTLGDGGDEDWPKSVVHRPPFRASVLVSTMGAPARPVTYLPAPAPRQSADEVPAQPVFYGTILTPNVDNDDNDTILDPEHPPTDSDELPYALGVLNPSDDDLISARLNISPFLAHVDQLLAQDPSLRSNSELVVNLRLEGHTRAFWTRDFRVVLDDAAGFATGRRTVTLRLPLNELNDPAYSNHPLIPLVNGGTIGLHLEGLHGFKGGLIGLDGGLAIAGGSPGVPEPAPPQWIAVFDANADLPPTEVVVDHNRDGKLDSSDARPKDLANQGAYNTAGAFQQKGAIVWANLDYDEENVASGKPVPDTIRFWHNGQTFEHSDEDFKIKNGERSIAPYLDGYEAPPAEEISSSCSDVAPIKLSRLNSLPADSKVLLRVARAEDLRAFHFYKRIPDFSQGDAEESAIWGAFQQSGAPWAGEDHVIDSRTIDLTKWVNEQASNYVGYQQTRRTEEAPFVFGIEAMLYKGMKYDFNGGAGGKEFDGNLDFTVVLKNAQGQETEIDKVRLTCLRLPAFPGAQGFGMWSQGGRGGEVYKVTNLNDSGPGSLREGISSRSNLGAGFPGTERKKPRTIIFEVGGRIALGQQDKLNIGRGLLTIAGQTAAGQGITLTDATFRVSGAEGATGKAINKPNDVIVRYMRSRRATSVPSGKDLNSSSDYPMGPDAFEIKSASRVIVDHCSFSGGIDGSMDIIQANQAANEQPEMDVTAQWCFVHHTLDPHSKASLLRGKFGARYSILGCFYGHNEMRNPELGWLTNAGATDSQRALIEFSDNVIYNWKDRFCGVTQVPNTPTGVVPSNLRIQFLSNYYKPGNDTDDPVTAFQIQSTGDTLYFANNRMRGSVWSSAYEFVGNHGAAVKASSPFITHFTSAGNALTARDKVRTHGGASRSRDVADLAYVEEVPPGTENPKYAVTGTIPSALVSSYPPSGALPGYSDSDNDGMADSWESGYAGSGGINKFLPWKDDDGDGWTNLEEYLNKTNPKVGDDPMKTTESNVDGPLF